MQKNSTDVRISNINQVQAVTGGICNGYCANEIYTLEMHLEACASHSRFAPLWISWKSEKAEYISKLKTVDKTFMTFSSHDADHSKMIVQRIEALLGPERIRMLSPTDTWLILQCAYTHDLGMCVTEREKEDLLQKIYENPKEAAKILGDTDYITYVETLSKYENTSKINTNNGTKVSAYFWQKRLEENDVDFSEYVKNVFGSDFSRALYYYNLTIMNFFRKKHAERSYQQVREDAVNKTYGDVFPVRLRYIIADIDRCHGLDWGSVLDLDYEQNGFDNDFIHPRFIAALLRLGDLLDLDSNRFNQFIYNNVRTKPLASQVHRIKHMTVTNLLVNTKEIRIVSRFDTQQIRHQLNKDNLDARGELLGADFSDAEALYSLIVSSAKTSEMWMNMIRSDSQEFALSWNEIAPSNFPGNIAVLNQSEIYLDNQLIKPSDLNLSYEISSIRASQIIEGSGLYKSSLAFLRELIQNAVDATKIQMYLEICEDYVTIKDLLLRSYQDFILNAENLRNEHKIEVRFEIVYDKDSALPQKMYVEIEDRGTGISEDRLLKMKNIGNIIDLSLKESIKNMPEWMKPTGDFGIGMQSVFTYTDRFRVITRPRKKEGDRFVERRIMFNSTRLGGDIINRDTYISSVNQESSEKGELTLNHCGTKIHIELDLSDVKILNMLFSEKVTSKEPCLLNIQDKLLSIIKNYIDETFVGEIVPIEFSFIGFESKNIPGNREESKKSLNLLNSPLQFRLLLPSNQSPIQFIDYPKYKNYNKRTENEKSVFYCYSEENDISKCVTVHFRRTNEKYGKARLFFRGIAFEVEHHDEDYDQISKMIRIPYFDCCINILCEKASNLIEINRDRVVRERYTDLCFLLQNCLVAFFKDLFLLIGNKKDEDNTFLKNFETIINDKQSIWNYLYAVFLVNFNSYVLSATEKSNILSLLSDKNKGMLDGALLDINGKIIRYDSFPIKHLINLEKNAVLYTDSSNVNSIKLVEALPNEYGEKYVYMIQNWFSDIFKLYYQKLHVYRPEGWDTNLIKVYQLTNDENVFPLIDQESYCLIVDSIIRWCLQELQNGKITEEYYPSFPAILEFKDLSVEELPVGALQKEKDRYNKWIISPIPIKAFNKDRMGTNEINLLLELPNFISVVDFINKNQKEKREAESIKLSYLEFLKYIKRI